jgi:hypothetical protein
MHSRLARITNMIKDRQSLYLHDLSMRFAEAEVIFSQSIFKLVPSQGKNYFRVSKQWGEFPWHKPTNVDSKSKFEAKHYFEFALVVLQIRMIINILRIVRIYTAYLPYRKLQISQGDPKYVFVSPCFHLNEFLDGDKNLGVWGDVKFLDSDLSQDSKYVLLPFKENKYSSHKDLCKVLKRIQMNGKFRIVHVSSYFSFRLLVRILASYAVYYFLVSINILKLCLVVSFGLKDVKKIGVLLKCLDTTDIESIINFELSRAALKKTSKTEAVFLTMEGQPWEIGVLLNLNSFNPNVRRYPVAHVPVRPENTQIFNYLLNGNSLNVTKYLISDTLTAQTLTGLGLSEDQIYRVEAQRFTRMGKPGFRYTYDPNVKSVLYIEDYHQEEILELVNILKELKMTHEIDLFVSPHPAKSTISSDFFEMFKDIRSSHENSFALAIFGSTTSALLEDKYSRLLKAVFLPTSSKQFSSTPGSFAFSSFSELESVMAGVEFVPSLSDSVTRSSDFSRWANLLGRVKEI